MSVLAILMHGCLPRQRWKWAVGMFSKMIQGMAYLGLSGMSSVSAREVAVVVVVEVGCACALVVAGAPLTDNSGKLVLKFLYRSSVGFCEVLLEERMNS